MRKSTVKGPLRCLAGALVCAISLSLTCAPLTAFAAEGTKSGLALMKEWKEKNKDVMGYLYIPGTTIDYPIVQGKTNLYYESRDYNGNVVPKYSFSATYADQDVKASSKNIILYGHNWTNYSSNPKIDDPNDVMFAQLTGYHHLSYAQKHPYIYYSDTARGDAKWQVFASFYTTDLRFYLQTEGSPTAIAKKAKQLSLHNYNVEVGENDTILTLSTCTRNLGQFANQRFVVMAKKVSSSGATTGSGEKKSAAPAQKEPLYTKNWDESSSSD